MYKKTLFLILLFSLAMLITACEDFTSGVDPFIDRVEDERLDSESQVPFVINGVKARFATTHDWLTVETELLSDAMFFSTTLPGASYPTFRDIDDGNIEFDNTSVHNVFMDIGELRFFADNLVERTGKIEFSDEALKKEALYTGNLFGGVARYWYASYFGLTEEQGGCTIDNGAFIPSDQMYQLAIEKFTAALENTDDAYEKKVVNSLIARCYLYNGDYANAQTYAQTGLVEGDEPFLSLYSTEADNYFWQQAGAGRTQAAAAFRFNDYIEADPAEASRVLIESLLGNDDSTYYRQAKYPAQDSPIALITWQENELMLAELELRAANDAGALVRINAVRASYGISALASADMSVLIEERDKELCFTGSRLIDQRRFDADYNTWHLADGLWKYLPIVERERNINPNIGG